MLSHTDTLMCGQNSEQINAKVRELRSAVQSSFPSLQHDGLIALARASHVARLRLRNYITWLYIGIVETYQICRAGVPQSPAGT